MRELTFICAYYLNAGMLREQVKQWSSYPEHLKRRFHAIVTDDGSPHSTAREAWGCAGIASQRLFRAHKDIRWNWLFCRNLGVEHATTDWVLLTDIDHLLPLATLDAILSEDLDPACVYRTLRADAPHPLPFFGGGTDCAICERLWRKLEEAKPKAERQPWPRRHVVHPYKQHPNTWLMTRAMFFKIGGYDERFSGFYGSDSEFRERVQANSRAVVTLPHPLVRYPREIIPDASTTTYERKVKGLDDFNVSRIKADLAALPPDQRRPLRLLLKWNLEASC